MVRCFPLAACLLAASSILVLAEPTLPPELLDRARAAIVAGQLGEAEDILGTVREDLVDRNDLDFLRGSLAVAQGDYDKAISAFRAILSRDPSLNRVRLDLARALFLDGDDEAAEHHFRIAEAAGLPPEVQKNVERFLDEIKRRKRWGVDVALGIAPDSNVNAGTGARTVNLYGLPFSLDDNARAKSGVGFAGSLSGSYQFRLDPDTRLVMGGKVSDLDYEGNQFDDRSVSAFVGPRFLIGRGSEITLAATGARRWYGGSGYSTGFGARLAGEKSLSPRLLASASLDVQQMTYDDIGAYDGPVVAANGGATYGLDAASFLRVDVAIMREQARDEPFRDTQYFLSANYYREFPLGFGVNIGAGIDFARYDAQLAAFDLTRHDTTVTARLAVSNNHIDIYGFTPVVAYTHVERMSDIDLYAFSRDRVEISLTRNF